MRGFCELDRKILGYYMNEYLAAVLASYINAAECRCSLSLVVEVWFVISIALNTEESRR